MELDVLGVRSTSNGSQRIHACEVLTHINGLHYRGSPDTDEWEEFGNNAYQYSLQRIWEKFELDHSLLSYVFDSRDEYVLQLWSPIVPQGTLTDGLAELQDRFESAYDVRIELVINEQYTNRVNELRERASQTTKSYDEPAFRFFQIIEYMRGG